MRIPHAPAAVVAAGALIVLGLVGACGASTTSAHTAPAPVGRPARPVTAYVVGTPPCMGNTVTLIDTAANKALKAIKVGAGTDAIAITPDGRTAYVVSGRPVTNGTFCGQAPPPADTVTPISTATNTALTPIPVGQYPSAIAITPDGRTAYVVNDGSGTVTPISTATNTAGKAIRFGEQGLVAGADHIAITPDGRTAYVTNYNSYPGTVTPISTATNTALTPIEVTSGAVGIAITPDGRTAYAIGSNTIVPIRTATNAAGKAITVPGADLAGLGITPDGKTAYILNEIFEPGYFPGTVIPLRTATNTAGKPITVESGPTVIAFTP